MTDYTKMHGPELQEACSDRAELWAEAFMQINEDATTNGSPIDIDLAVMKWWFRQAIEGSHTVRMQRYLAEPSPTWRDEHNRAVIDEMVDKIYLTEPRRAPTRIDCGNPLDRKPPDELTAGAQAVRTWPDDADQAFWDGSQWTPEQARMIAAKAKS